MGWLLDSDAVMSVFPNILTIEDTKPILTFTFLYGTAPFTEQLEYFAKYSLTMGLFAATMPEAVLPCVVSLIVEACWFAILTKYIDRMWPPAVDYDKVLTEEAELP